MKMFISCFSCKSAILSTDPLRMRATPPLGPSLDTWSVEAMHADPKVLPAFADTNLTGNLITISPLDKA